MFVRENHCDRHQPQVTNNAWKENHPDFEVSNPGVCVCVHVCMWVCKYVVCVMKMGQVECAPRYCAVRASWLCVHSLTCDGSLSTALNQSRYICTISVPLWHRGMSIWKAVSGRCGLMPPSSGPGPLSCRYSMRVGIISLWEQVWVCVDRFVQVGESRCVCGQVSVWEQTWMGTSVCVKAVVCVCVNRWICGQTCVWEQVFVTVRAGMCVDRCVREQVFVGWYVCVWTDMCLSVRAVCVCVCACK